jgi:retron-type reverse transcriptase
MFGQAYNETIAIDNLLYSWEEFLRGKKTRNDVAAFQVRLMDNICALQRLLTTKTYIHQDYQAFNISDPKPRNIHKATVRDRLLHHLIYRALYPYFDKKFIYDSYSCRNDKGIHKAMNRFREFASKVSRNNTRTCWVLKCDIRKFFASVDHAVLKKILARYIADTDLLWLIGTVIDSFQTEGTPGTGLPLGNLTSQLFVNIYMNEFDQFAKRQLKSRFYVRYADDFVFLSEEKHLLESLIPKIDQFLKSQLKLTLHPRKVSISTFASGVDFLGWVHFPDHRVLRTTTKRRMFKKMDVAASPATEASYLGLLQHGNGYRLKKQLGQ